MLACTKARHARVIAIAAIAVSIAIYLAPFAWGQAQTADLQPADSAGIRVETAAAKAPQESTIPAMGSSVSSLTLPLLRALGGLGLVLSLILAGFFAAKKFAPQYLGKRPSERQLKIVETLSLGDKRAVSLIQVDGRQFLVGNTPHQINLLASLSESPLVISEPGAKDRFRTLYEVEKNSKLRDSGRQPKGLTPDVRAKLRQLQETLEG